MTKYISKEDRRFFISSEIGLIAGNENNESKEYNKTSCRMSIENELGKLSQEEYEYQEECIKLWFDE